MGLVKPSSGGGGTAPTTTASISDSFNKRFVTDNEKKVTSVITGTSYTVGTGGLQAFKVVYLSTLDTVLTADSSNQTHCGRVLGFILENHIVGDTVIPIMQGEVTNSAWSLVAGDTYFLGNGGDITNVPPSTGFVQKLGIAKNANTLIVKVESPIKLI